MSNHDNDNDNDNDTKTKTTPALVLHGPKDLRLEPRPLPSPGPHDLLLRLTHTGLCGSDLHYYTHFRNGDFLATHPFVPGHESIATVLSPGPSVPPHTFPPGARVALEVGLPCESDDACWYCRTGRYNLCPRLRFRSSAKTTPHLDGTLARTTVHPAAWCHRIPDSISDLEGALIEPLAVCVHAIQRRPLREEERGGWALVFGAGAMGMLLASALEVGGGFEGVVLADIEGERLGVAGRLPGARRGVIRTYLLPRPQAQQQAQSQAKSKSWQQTVEEENTAAKDTAAALREAFLRDCAENVHGQGFIRTYDATGAPPCIRAGIHATSPGGALVLIGMGGPSCPAIPLPAAASKEVDVVGVFRYGRGCYGKAIEMLGGEGMKGVGEAVVTHVVGLGEGGGRRAFEVAGGGRDEGGRTVVKVVVVNSKL